MAQLTKTQLETKFQIDNNIGSDWDLRSGQMLEMDEFRNYAKDQSDSFFYILSNTTNDIIEGTDADKKFASEQRVYSLVKDILQTTTGSNSSFNASDTNRQISLNVPPFDFSADHIFTGDVDFQGALTKNSSALALASDIPNTTDDILEGALPNRKYFSNVLAQGAFDFSGTAITSQLVNPATGIKDVVINIPDFIDTGKGSFTDARFHRTQVNPASSVVLTPDDMEEVIEFGIDDNRSRDVVLPDINAVGNGESVTIGQTNDSNDDGRIRVLTTSGDGSLIRLGSITTTSYDLTPTGTQARNRQVKIKFTKIIENIHTRSLPNIALLPAFWHITSLYDSKFGELQLPDPVLATAGQWLTIANVNNANVAQWADLPAFDETAARNFTNLITFSNSPRSRWPTIGTEVTANSNDNRIARFADLPDVPSTSDDLRQGTTNLYVNRQSLYDVLEDVLAQGTGIELSRNDITGFITFNRTVDAGTAFNINANYSPTGNWNFSGDVDINNDPVVYAGARTTGIHDDDYVIYEDRSANEFRRITKQNFLRDLGTSVSAIQEITGLVPISSGGRAINDRWFLSNLVVEDDWPDLDDLRIQLDNFEINSQIVSYKFPPITVKDIKEKMRAEGTFTDADGDEIITLFDGVGNNEIALGLGVNNQAQRVIAFGVETPTSVRGANYNCSMYRIQHGVQLNTENSRVVRQAATATSRVTTVELPTDWDNFEFLYVSGYDSTTGKADYPSTSVRISDLTALGSVNTHNIGGNIDFTFDSTTRMLTGSLSGTDDDVILSVVLYNLTSATPNVLDLSQIENFAKTGDTTALIPLTRLPDSVPNNTNSALLATQIQDSDSLPLYDDDDNDDSKRATVGELKKLFMSATTPPTPTYQAPAITSMSISGLDQNNPPVAGTNIGGDRTLTYAVSNPQNVQGNLTLTFFNGSSSETVTTGVSATATTQAINITDTNFVDGTTYRFTLSGTDTQGNSLSRSITLRRAGAGEFLYFGASDNTNWSSLVLPTGEQRVDVSSSRTMFETVTTAMPTGIRTNNGQYFYILAPSNREPTSLVHPIAGESITEFTKTEDVRTISGQSYNVFFFQNNSGFAGNNRYTGVTE